ncbi:MAG: superoxide dismutase, partial [Okeania sp. SIO2H7]|nr:superoxide dismutase [Okeania sp. SIO2H7]
MNINRRKFLILKSATLGSMVLSACQTSTDHSSSSVTPSTSINDTKSVENSGVFQLTPLPYEYDALEPYIDQETMQFH